MNANERERALRLLVYGLLLSWLWKWDFWSSAVVVYRARPLVDEFFPLPLQSFALLAFAYALPAITAFIALLQRGARALGASLCTFALGSLVLMLHQGTYNDASFVTCFWTALFGLWLVSATRGATASQVAARAGALVQLLCALMFFGGVVGKLTPGYFDGSVLYEIYFVKRQHWTFSWLRAHADAATLREVARWYSRAVLLIEALLVTLPLWPLRLSMRLALASLGMLVVLNNFRLLSVVGPLIAACGLVLWLLAREEQALVSDAAPASPPAGT